MNARPLLMPRHEAWRYAYREHRYCAHLLQPELNARIRDIVLNMLRVTPEGKIGLPTMNDAGQRWMELWTHVLEEMVLRHGPFPRGFTHDVLHREPFPDFATELSTKAAQVLAARSLAPGQALIKYGKPDHLRGLLERGTMRVQCASYYSSPDHNGAVRDDELSLALSFSLTREQMLRLVVNPEDVPERLPNQRVDFSYKSDSDFWLFCVTRSVEPRLFIDFAATACVLIHDPAAFANRLQSVVYPHWSNTTYQEGPAIYVDPLLPIGTRFDIPFSKHFRYSYQDEVRFVWHPNERAEKLPHADISIGPLTDIAELIEL